MESKLPMLSLIVKYYMLVSRLFILIPLYFKFNNTEDVLCRIVLKQSLFLSSGESRLIFSQNSALEHQVSLKLQFI